MKLFKKKDVRTEFLPSAIEIVETPASPLGKFSIWSVFLVVLAVIIWSFGKVDEVTSARGKIIPTGNTNIIQSLTGGVIKSINVKEGDEVKEGQTLLTIDDSILKNEKSKLENELEVLKTSKDILEAYKDGKQPNVDVEKFKESKGLIIQKLGYSETINKIYSNNLNNMDIDIEQLRSDLERIKQRLSEEEEKLAKFNSELKNVEQSNVVDIETKKREIEASENGIKSIKESIKSKENSLKIKENEKENSVLNQRQELGKELVNVLQLMESHTKDIEKMDKRIKDLDIKSPVEGKVQKSAVNTVGGVIQAGAPIIHIVPKNKELVIEAMVLNKDIGFVSEGQKAEVKFDTFDFQRYGTVEGTINQITPDAVDVNGQSMYKVSVKLNEKDMDINGKKMKFAPGMTVTCEITTSERRIIDFFIPGIKDIKNSFKLR